MLESNHLCVFLCVASLRFNSTKQRRAKIEKPLRQVLCYVSFYLFPDYHKPLALNSSKFDMLYQLAKGSSDVLATMKLSDHLYYPKLSFTV